MCVTLSYQGLRKTIGGKSFPVKPFAIQMVLWKRNAEPRQVILKLICLSIMFMGKAGDQYMAENHANVEFGKGRDKVIQVIFKFIPHAHVLVDKEGMLYIVVIQSPSKGC